jgi:2-phospho-L-lactate transferase/gluconeogenesis factor (CofD/UPF0052 family)
MQIKAVIFAGGRGASSLIKHFTTLQNDLKYLDLTVIVNAYDNGLSTGIVRQIYNIQGPSDIRKNQITLLDHKSEYSSSIEKFIGFRFSSKHAGKEKKILRSIADKDEKGIIKGKGLIKKWKNLPPEMKELVSSGIDSWLKFIKCNDIEIEYHDFNIGNIIYAGLTGKNGNLQKTADLLAASMPIKGKVIINSLENLFLYGICELKSDDHKQVILDEADIVEHRSSIRIKAIFLIDKPLTAEKIDELKILPIHEIEHRLNGMSRDYIIPAPEALKAIQEADLLIYGPGTQFSSLLPTYLTDDFAETIAENQNAKKIFICNICEDADTIGFSAPDIVEEAVYYLTKKNRKKKSISDLINYILINNPSDKIEKKNYVAPHISRFSRWPNINMIVSDPQAKSQSERLEFNDDCINVICTSLEDTESGLHGKHSGIKLSHVILDIINNSEKNLHHYHEGAFPLSR